VCFSHLLGIIPLDRHQEDLQAIGKRLVMVATYHEDEFVLLGVEGAIQRVHFEQGLQDC
jgi:hypothetical protein